MPNHTHKEFIKFNAVERAVRPGRIIHSGRISISGRELRARDRQAADRSRLRGQESSVGRSGRTKQYGDIMAEIEKKRVIALLNQILESELAGVVRYTHYSLLVYGYNRIPIVSWLREQAIESLTHAQLAGESLDLPAVRFTLDAQCIALAPHQLERFAKLSELLFVILRHRAYRHPAQ